MAKQQSISRGQRFRDVQVGSFGQPGPEWIVDGIFIGTDGLTYAYLVSGRDSTQRKTLSLDILGDRHRFVEV